LYVFLENGETDPLLPANANRNRLHVALVNGHYEEASKLIKTETEDILIECFENQEGISPPSYKSSLHIIAGLKNKEQAERLCRELLDKVTQPENRELLLNATTVEDVRHHAGTVRASVAAIHIAACSGNSGVVRLLCQEYGVDVNCNTSETLTVPLMKGVTALYWASANGHVKVVEQLLGSNANVNGGSANSGATPLYIAAYVGHTEVVQILLDNNADVNAGRADIVATPLYVAAREGHVQVVELLLAKIANVSASRTDIGATPLYVAAREGHKKIVKLLLDHKADVNVRRTDDGATPLYVAAHYGHAEVVKLLLDNNADVNAGRGDTPLYVAARIGRKKVVKLLLAYGADVNAEGHDGRKPVDAARQFGHVDIVKLFQ